MFVFSGKSHCCNDTFTDVLFTDVLQAPPSKEYLIKRQTVSCAYNTHFLSYVVSNFHPNWLISLRVMQEKQGSVFWNTSTNTLYRNRLLLPDKLHKVYATLSSEKNAKEL